MAEPANQLDPYDPEDKGSIRPSRPNLTSLPTDGVRRGASHLGKLGFVPEDSKGMSASQLGSAETGSKAGGGPETVGNEEALDLESATTRYDSSGFWAGGGDGSNSGGKVKASGFFGQGRGKNRRGLLIGGGVGGGILGLLVLGFLSLIPLKIEHIVSNVENYFMRNNTSAIQTEEENLTKNFFSIPRKCTGRYITSECSVTISGKNPISNLYSAWHTAKLEDTLSKNGINFSFDKNNPTKLTVYIDGVARDFDTVMSRSEFSDLKAKILTNMDNATKWQRVMVRYKLGRLVEEKYNVRRCILFCGSKKYLDLKVNQAKVAAKEFILSRVIGPTSSVEGEAITCFLKGLSACVDNYQKPQPDNPNVPAEEQEYNGYLDQFDASVRADLAKEASKYGLEVEDLAKFGTGNSNLDKALAKYYQTKPIIGADGKPEIDKNSGTAKTQIATDAEGNPIFKSYSQVLAEQVLHGATDLGSETIAKLGTLVGESETGVGAIVAAVQLMDQAIGYIHDVSHISTALKHISYVTHAVAAVSTYMTYRSFADEMKTGNVTPQEVGSFVDSLGPNSCSTQNGGSCPGGTASAEEAPTYNYYVSSNANTSTTTGSLFASLFSSKVSADATVSSYNHTVSTQKDYRCNDNSQLQSSQAICPEEQFGQVQGQWFFKNAQDFVNKSGLGVLASLWSSHFNLVHDLIGLSNSVLGGIVNVAGSLLNFSCSNFLTEAGASVVIPGGPVFVPLYCQVISPAIKTATQWFGGWLQDIFSYLVPSPVSLNMSGGRTFDEIAAGADQTSSDFGSNVIGGRKLTNQEVANIQSQQIQHEQQSFEQQPLAARLFDTNSPYSLITKLAMDVPMGSASTVSQSSLASILSNPFGKIFGAFGSIFSKGGSVFAAAPAGSDLYNIPQIGYSNPSDFTSPPVGWSENSSSGSPSSTSGYSALVGTGASFAGTDQGIDFVPSGSSPYQIYAPASGTITQADQTGHRFNRTKGQAEVILHLDQAPSAPNSSQYIYFAELIQINSNITVGTHVNKGDVIGTNNTSPGIEIGWARDATNGFLCPLTSGATACGQSFKNWVQGDAGTASAKDQCPGYPAGQTTFSSTEASNDPCAYWVKYCEDPGNPTQINPSIIDAYNSNADTNIDPTTGMPTPQQTDPCQLIQATVGSVGGLFSCNLLTPDDLADGTATSTSTTSSSTLTLTYGSLSATVYLPPDGLPHPLVLFAPGQNQNSHNGFYDNYLKAIASQGFVVAGINFPDNNSSSAEQADAQDIAQLAQQIPQNSQLQGRLTPGQVGLIGHSDGAIDALIAGYGSAHASGINAIIAEDGALPSNSTSNAGPPLLLMHGTADEIQSIQSGSNQIYPVINAPYKGYAEFLGAHHYSYLTGNSESQAGGANDSQFNQAADDMTVAFLKRFLTGDNSSATDLQAVAAKYPSLISFEQQGNSTASAPSASASSSSTSTSTTTSGSYSCNGNNSNPVAKAINSEPSDSVAIKNYVGGQAGQVGQGVAHIFDDVVGVFRGLEHVL